MSVDKSFMIFGAICECPALNRDADCCYQFLENEPKKKVWQKIRKLSETEKEKLSAHCTNCYLQKVAAKL